MLIETTKTIKIGYSGTQISPRQTATRVLIISAATIRVRRASNPKLNITKVGPGKFALMTSVANVRAAKGKE